jgi:hypothetical protein
MTSRELENLVEIGKLRREPYSEREFRGLVDSAEARLPDAANPTLNRESRFDLAYNAAHALALAALRYAGYRSQDRYLVFQALPHTLGMPRATVRVLATCHDRRNRVEYEGLLDISDRLVSELLAEATRLRDAVRALKPIAMSNVQSRQ